MLKNIIKILFSNVVLLFIGLINSFIFPILLTIEDYAYYQEYMLYISYVNICHLGIASGMFLNYAGKNYKKIDKQQYKSEIYLIYIVLIIFTFIGLFIYDITNKALLFYTAVTIIPQCLIASFLALYQAWERFSMYSIINILPKLIFTVFVLFMYWITKTINIDWVIISYIIISWSICMYFNIEFISFTKNVTLNKIFSKTNKNTVWNGFLITLGNYVNLLFHSIDKQFVSIFYSIASFALYSFAMSMQNFMLLFITALSTPFYPRLAKEDVSEEYIKTLKELLLIFGAYSGCVYFVISYFIKHFVTKYTDSLIIVAIFFAVFPAMAVINVLYINLYKIRKLLKRYILTLVGILFLVGILDYISILIVNDYIGISIATLIVYYIWMIYSQFDFKDININKIDYIFLFGFFIIYITSVIVISNDVLGFILYGLIISLWSYFTYCKTVKFFINSFKMKSHI